MRANIYAYHPASRSAKILAESLGIKRIRHSNSRFNPALGRLVFNWGASELPVDHPANHTHAWVNPPPIVKQFKNREEAFNFFNGEGLSIPRVMNSSEDIEASSRREFVVRNRVGGRSGYSINILSKEQALDYTLDRHQMMVEYIPKRREYRFHWVRGLGVVDIQVKLTREDNPNWKVRTSQNGFFFSRSFTSEDEDYLSIIGDQINSTETWLPLDFAAIDVIYNSSEGRAYFLEANTAPGLEGRTVEVYHDIFKHLYAQARDADTLPDIEPML